MNRTAVAGALSASVAHELNQPLGAIRSYAEAAALYLKADPPNIERVEKILASISGDNQRAADIIDHLRGLLKKKEADELEEFDLTEVVKDTLEIVRPEASKKGVELNVTHANGSLPVRADRVHVQQVILNLAMNGLDAMHSCTPGSGKMSIETALVDETAIEVSVTDSGTGIPKDRLNKIFDTFYTTKRQGTGLGLSIARTIVETYGGKIWAENRSGGGAMFRFTLPLSRTMVAMTDSSPIIHVVDDDASFRSAMGELLSASGYRVSLYKSAKELIETTLSRRSCMYFAGCANDRPEWPAVAGPSR